MDFDVWSVFTVLSVLPASIAFSLIIALALKPDAT